MADLTGTSALSLPSLSLASGGVRYKNYPTSLSANTELVSDTYLMSANCDCNSYKLTFDCAAGSIVVKRSGDYYHTEQGAVDTTNSSATNKVYLTVLNDDTIGTILPGSTGSPAVSGGSWGNGTAIGNYHVVFNYLEIRWADNKQFLNCGAGGTTYIRSVQNVIWKNCVYSSVTAITLSTGSHASNAAQRFQADNSNTITGSASLLSIGLNCGLSYVYVQDGTTTSTAIVWVSGAPTGTVYSFIKIKNTGAGHGFATGFDSNKIIYVKHCMTSILGGSGPYKLLTYNCVFTDHAYGIQSNGSGSGAWVTLRVFGCIFKGLTTGCFTFNNYRGLLEACRDNIFDSNAKIIVSASSGQYQTKNNAYYGNTSESSWSRGTYDATISNPSFGNFPNGTLHDDWITYGPGDGWYTTQDLSTGADTNSFNSVDYTTQSHTGIQETATTQRLGIAPVFSTLESA